MPGRNAKPKANCEGDDQPIEVSTSDIAGMSDEDAKETIIRMFSDECPNCALLSTKCFPEVSWHDQTTSRIVAVISQRLK